MSAPTARWALRRLFIRGLFEATIVNNAICFPVIAAPFLRNDSARPWALYGSYYIHNASRKKGMLRPVHRLSGYEYTLFSDLSRAAGKKDRRAL